MARPAPISVRTTDLKRLAAGWLLDCQYRQHSACTVTLRRGTVEKFFWWLDREGITSVGLAEIRSFMLYLRTGHDEPEGRFGNPHLLKPLSARSVKDWHVNLSTLFTFLVTEGYLDGTPMEGLKPPIHRPDRVQPFTEEQVQALIRAARKSRYPKRNEAIILFLLDTGVRVSKLANLRLGSVGIVDDGRGLRWMLRRHRPNGPDPGYDLQPRRSYREVAGTVSPMCGCYRLIRATGCRRRWCG